MFTIGEFAKHGSVSVRMLRHYDAIGLLSPAYTAPGTGYRYYQAAQLARLNRVIALKELGFTLDQVRSILDGRVTAEELRGMLRLRQAELETAVARARAGLVQVAARLRSIEEEGAMPAEEVVVKPLAPLRLAELTGTAASFDPRDVSPVIGPLFTGLCHRLDTAGVAPTGPGVALYEDAEDGTITVRAGLPVTAAEVPGAPEVRIVERPGVERAATVIHRGPMDDVVSTAQRLARWIDAGGHRAAGYPREVTLAAPEDPAGWVTELQQPLAAPH
ncbi:MerR family transcriptional regulator [Streptomyces pactum]|uniref:MerR family transcriptional regulator n=1 Tax=Streptomyces pactum TaxID=68249 RepID=A0ABS0NSI2_9ACTN|nr:MerR family transcriptional regulator [Streptomyces pactum]MBH5338175.1 MerR family transcriptional regulator [Streptomyces pactum]